MSEKYSTGELAKLCNTTVRAVQFYDAEGLLKPEGYSEGGRRLYGENSLETLQLICMYKSVGISLGDIKQILADESERSGVLIAVIEQREKALDEELRQKLNQKDCVREIKSRLKSGVPLSAECFNDATKIMQGKRKLKATYATMLVVGLLMDALEIGTIVLWIVKGIWWPFAVGMPLVVLAGVLLVVVYRKNTAYVCRGCGKKFRPRLREWFFAVHTPSARKLTCPHCGYRGYQAETYVD